jgi:ribosomal protein S3
VVWLEERAKDPLLQRVSSVGGGASERCGSQSNTLVGSVEYRVESLEESLAVDEVESRSTCGTNITDNQINNAGNTTNVTVKGTRPDLTVGSQSE